MSRRRRLQDLTTNAENSGNSELSNLVDMFDYTTSAEGLQPTLQQRGYESRLPIHPILTDYGPGSLRAFLIKEEERWHKNNFDAEKGGSTEYRDLLSSESTPLPKSTLR